MRSGWRCCGWCRLSAAGVLRWVVRCLEFLARRSMANFKDAKGAPATVCTVQVYIRTLPGTVPPFVFISYPRVSRFLALTPKNFFATAVQRFVWDDFYSSLFLFWLLRNLETVLLRLRNWSFSCKIIYNILCTTSISQVNYNIWCTTSISQVNFCWKDFVPTLISTKNCTYVHLFFCSVWKARSLMRGVEMRLLLWAKTLSSYKKISRVKAVQQDTGIAENKIL